jgi:heparan-alpha-glucosaminide N-acetyltransferase
MVFGLFAGRVVMSDNSAVRKVGQMILIGALLAGAGWAAGEHACPIVKRIWTPSWTLFSGGMAFLVAAGFMALNQLLGLRLLLMPLVIVGMNSIFAYLAAQWSKRWLSSMTELHLGHKWWTPGLEPIFEACIPLALIWLLCFWLYRCRAFLRI